MIKPSALFILIVFFCNVASVIAQDGDEFPKLPLDKETGLIMYEEVVTVSDADKNELYVRALKWFDTFYNTKRITSIKKSFYPNPSQVIELSDPVKGEIIGQAAFNLLGKQMEVDDIKTPEKNIEQKPAANKAANSKNDTSKVAKVPKPEEKEIAASLILIYNIRILFKEGKYKYVINHIRFDKSAYYGVENWYNKSSPTKNDNIENLKKVDAYFKDLIQDLNKGMLITSKVPDDDDW